MCIGLQKISRPKFNQLEHGRNFLKLFIEFLTIFLKIKNWINCPKKIQIKFKLVR